MTTLYDSVNTVLKRLDDYPTVSGEQAYTRAEIELYLQDGYNVFCRQTKCILDFYYAENIAQAGNYVATWELGYYESGMIAVGLLGYTGGYWERDYALPGATGPANLTQPWEDEYLSTTFAVSRHPVPQDNVAVDRATHDWEALSPEWTRWFEQNDRSYETTTGDPSRFSFDRDGMSSLRIVPAGTGNATVYAVSGTYGLLRTAGNSDGFGTWAPIGSWGILREIPEHFPMGGQFGIPRRLFSDDSNTRVEYFRLGKDLDEYPYELPSRFQKYPEFYAQAKALERDGPGQDLALARHFMERFNEGIARMVRRLSENVRSRVAQIGATGKFPAAPALARLPYRYGRQIRRGY